MQIILTQEELELAAKNFVLDQINVAEDQDISVDFTAGRGANGLTATIDISAKSPKQKSKPVTRATPAVEEVPETAPVEAETKPAKTKPAFAKLKAKAEKPEPEAEPEEVEEEVAEAPEEEATDTPEVADEAAEEAPVEETEEASAEEEAPAPKAGSIFSMKKKSA